MLEKLKFGRDDAESEQEFLQRVFFSTNLYKRVKNNDKWLVLGRKGSGKTAICLTLFHQLNNDKAFVSLIEPANFSVSTYMTLEKGSLDFSEAAMLSWKYVFLIELSKYVVQVVSEKEGKKKWSQEAQQVKQFLAQGESFYANWLDKALKKTNEYTKFEIEVGPIKGSLERNPSIQEASVIRDTLDDVSKHIQKCMDSYFDQPVYILVDKIDELWNEKTESKELVIGLLKAAKDIRALINKAHLVVFLRSDIFDTLKFHDLDKYRSISERVIWDKESLLKLISRRIQVSLGGKSSAVANWQRVFSKTIDGVDSFDHLLQYTLMRPRDLIQLCNYCKDISQNLNLKKIDKTALLKTLPDYSRWQLDDLVIEYRFQYPFLEKVFWSVFYQSVHRFDINSLEDQIESQSAEWITEVGEDNIKPTEKLLEALYRIGFIGVLKFGQVLYYYHNVPITISGDMEFIIHPAFRTALAIKESLEHLRDVEVIKNRKDDKNGGGSGGSSGSGLPKPSLPPRPKPPVPPAPPPPP